MVLSAAGAAANDVYGSVWRRGDASEREEINAGRVAVVIIGGVGALLALGAGDPRAGGSALSRRQQTRV